ncbi:unnamed protein product [Caenorhabditis nigoni]|uniref:Uncharacterized protein n=1 Tax=Caenorhabditis nigoni TaxID=1611254 RepID=A0A2G5SF20_9PELO|nr:hypothetical protein B9Z55_027552 [Caenorhabditis nigoni]
MKWKHIGSFQAIVDVDEDLEMTSVHGSLALVVVEPEPGHVMAAQRTVLENSGTHFRQIDEEVVLLKLLHIPGHVCAKLLLIGFQWLFCCILPCSDEWPNCGPKSGNPVSPPNYEVEAY